MRPAFLTSPGKWLRTPRCDQSAADYASPVTRYEPARDRWLGVALAVVIGITLAAVLVAWWSA
jgi:hypothetical protein